MLDLLQFVKHIEEYNCSYVSATENFDTTTAAGKMVLQLLGVFAEFERERIRERVTDNMISIARNSNKVLSRPCFGYDIENGEYKINETESKHVLYMVELAEKGYGTRAIARELNAKNVLTKSGYMWDSTSVRRLLMTETIAGIRVFNKRKVINGKRVIQPKENWIITENNHEGIISASRFWKLQDILKSRARSRRHAENETYLLTGILKCGHCQNNMKGSTARVNRGKKSYIYHRYICSSYVRNYSCKHHFAHRDEIEKEVIKQIEYIAKTSTKNIKLKITTKTNSDEIKEVESALKRINLQMQRQIEAYEKGLLEDEDLKLATERVKEERKLLRAKLEMLKSKNNNVNDIKKNAKLLLPDITDLDRKKAKAAILNLIDSLILQEDGNIDIIWRV